MPSSNLNIFLNFMNNNNKNSELITLNENYSLIQLQSYLSTNLINCHIYNNFCNIDYENEIFNTYNNKIFGINKKSDYNYYIWIVNNNKKI
uniref:Uncharacterized protein n=1 Tax=viral metagenome TaxID=1070528 RepID=A0A6C0CFA0_9ZZZZ